jgi:hypothetical protein
MKKNKQVAVAGKSLQKAVRATRSKIIAEIKEIRMHWAKGLSDIEIREEMGLGWRGWMLRVRIMRGTLPDQDVVSVSRDYEKHHHKAVARLTERMKQLQKVHEHAMEEVEVYDQKQIDKKTKKPLLLYKRPRDASLAASTARELAMLDREILRTEQELINMKQRLGMIDPREPDVDEESVFDQAQIITAPNLMKAWQIRKELERKKAADALNGQKQIEEAVIVPATRPNVSSTK